MEILTNNKFSVMIDGTDYTKNVPFPIKWNNLLDEQLDEANISLIFAPKDIFPMLSEVTVRLWNESNPEKVKTICL